MVVNRIADVNRFRPSDQKLELPSPRTVYDRIQDAGPESILQRRPSDWKRTRNNPTDQVHNPHASWNVMKLILAQSTAS